MTEPNPYYHGDPLTAYYKGSVGFLALQATLLAIELKAVVVRASILKDAPDVYEAKVSELRDEIARFIKWCRAAKKIEEHRLAERKEVGQKRCV